MSSVMFDLSPELLDRMVDAAYAEFFYGTSPKGEYKSLEDAALDAIPHLHHGLMKWKLEHWRNIVRAALRETKS